MKHKQWEAVHAVFSQIYKFDIHLKTQNQEEDRPKESPEELENTDFLVKTRRDIRTQLDFLRSQLAEELTERDSYLVIFPIVALFDEFIQTKLVEAVQSGWPPLQKELFQIDDAGEAFYEILEDVLRKPQTLPFIYEVFYLCLNHGFLGKYNDNPVKIKEYMKKLREKIPVAELSKIEIEFDQAEQFNYISSRSKVYSLAGGALIVLYLLFHIIAKI